MIELLSPVGDLDCLKAAASLRNTNDWKERRMVSCYDYKRWRAL